MPLIIRIPNIEPKHIHHPVELIDLFPTIVNITAVQNGIPNCNDNETEILCFEGRNLLPLIKGENDENDQGSIAFSQYPRPGEVPQRNSDKPRLKDINIMGYSLRTERFRYTEWISFNSTNFKRNWNKSCGVELYDHKNDKFETTNLINVPTYRDLIRHFSDVLRKKFDRSDPTINI